MKAKPAQIFDFHLHPFIDPNNSIAGYGVPATCEDFFKHLKDIGITKCAGSVIRHSEPTSFADISRLNDEALKIRELYPDFYIPGIHVHPNFPVESCRELERLHAEGVRLIGELVWYMMGYKEYSTPAFNPVWELAERLGMTVSVHPTSIEDIEKVLTAFPHLNIVIAHPGEKKTYLANIELLKRHPNAYLDICGTGLFRYGMLAHGVHELGTERILFATDFPTCNAAMQIAAVLSEPLTEQQRDAIFHTNAEKLLAP